MSYGIEIKNENGDILVDGTNPNFGVYETGITTSYSYQYFEQTMYGVRITYTPTDEQPLLALRCTNRYAHFYGQHFKDANGKYYKFEAIQDSITSKIFEYALLLTSNNMLSTDNYGLNIYNNNNDLIFSSNFRNFIIKDIITVTPPYSHSGMTYSFSHAEVTNPYYIVDGVYGWVRDDPDYYSPSDHLLYVKNLSSTSGELYMGGFDPRDWDNDCILDTITVIIGELSY